MRTPAIARGLAAAALAAAALAAAPTTASADTYAYTTCGGVGYVFQTDSNTGSTTVMWYDMNGGWGYLAPNIHPCYQ